MNGWQASVLWIAMICAYGCVKAYLEREKPIINEYCEKCGKEISPNEAD